MRERELQKKLKSVERKIARLDDDKKSLNDKLLTITETQEAQELHTELTALASEVEQLEQQWLEIYQQLEGAS